MGGAFNPYEHEAAQGYEPLKPGWYPVEIKDAEIKATKAGTGSYLKIEFDVLDSANMGRKLFVQINLQNPSAKAVEIGMRELASLGQACQLQAITDTSELLGKRIEARVKIGKANEGYEPDNEVTAYRPLGQQTAPAHHQPSGQPATQHAQQPAQQQAAPVQQPAPQQPAPAVGGGGKMPWER